MRLLIHRFQILVILLGVCSQPIFTQETYQKNGFIFTVDIKNDATGIKDQALSGTCWSFSTLSMLESDLIRNGKGKYDLSEMFIVYYTYLEKAEKYIRMHGNISYTGGGALNDGINIMRKYGLMPESAYMGREYDFQLHNHEKMDTELKDYMDRIIADESFVTTQWCDSLKYILEKHMGKMPQKFIYESKEYTPIQFFQSLEINTGDYVLFGSYNHHPFYQRFILEVPDNWAWGEVCNVKVDEMPQIIDYALKKGYTVAWATDVTEDYFSWEHGIAVVPDTSYDSMAIFEKPVKETIITQELRQTAFDTYETTDDHGMHIIGLAHDQDGKEYYMVKNSWGTSGTCFGGYIFFSKAFLEYKTTSFYLHKNAIPVDIKTKFGI